MKIQENSEVTPIKMKFRFVPWIICSFLLAPQFAFSKTWGLGAVIGSPTGLSANYFLNNSRTIHSTLAYDFSGDDDLQIASHYTWRLKNLNFEKVNFGWFYGVGAKLAFKDHDHHHHNHHHDDDDGEIGLGPSGTIGLFHEFAEVPLELFLKANLTVNIIEDTDVNGDLMLGLHYNF